jgi:uncharacterized protein YutE (UPF0331/DUF86 family)
MTELIKAIASLLWPLLGVLILLLYYREIRSLLRGFRHGKIGGVEFDVAEQVQQVALKTIEVEAAAEAGQQPSLPVPTDVPQPEKYESDGSWRRDRMYVHAPEYEGEPPPAQDSSELAAASHLDKQRADMAFRMQLLDLASKDKSLAVLRVFNEVENEVQSLVATMGLLQFRGEFPSSFMGYVEILHEKRYITEELRDLLESFWILRNHVVHSAAPLASSTYASVLDTGWRLLGLLRTVPHEINRVAIADVPFYSDPQCQAEVLDARIVVLETVHPDGKTKNYRVYPTTQKYQPGQSVSWEWNRSRQWGPSWYRDSFAKNEIKSAWSGSVEFAGRRLETIQHY